MLTRDHITILLTIGTILSAALSLLTEWVVKRTRWGAVHAEWAKKWLPVVVGLPIGALGFPAIYGEVVRPIPLDWWVLAWIAFGAFLGLVAGAGSKISHDLAKAVLAKVAS